MTPTPTPTTLTGNIGMIGSLKPEPPIFPTASTDGLTTTDIAKLQRLSQRDFSRGACAIWGVLGRWDHSGACMSSLPNDIKATKGQARLYLRYNGGRGGGVKTKEQLADKHEIFGCRTEFGVFDKTIPMKYDEYSREYLDYLLTEENFFPVTKALAVWKTTDEIHDSRMFYWPEAEKLPIGLLACFGIATRTCWEKNAVFWRFHYLKEYVEPRFAFLLAHLNHPTSPDFEGPWKKHEGNHVMFCYHLEHKVKRWMAADPRLDLELYDTYGSEETFKTDIKGDFLKLPTRWNSLKEMIEYYRGYE